MFCLLVAPLKAQGIDLRVFNQERLEIQFVAMCILGSWALLNIVFGLWVGFIKPGQHASFFQMNVYWNLVNLFLALMGIWQSRSSGLDLSLWQTWQEQSYLEKLLLLNIGLDTMYIIAGLLLKEKGKQNNRKSQVWSGFGNALILQGAFLLLFDIGFWWVTYQHVGEYEEEFQKIGLHSSYKTSPQVKKLTISNSLWHT